MYEKVFAYLDAHAEDYAAQLCRWVEVPSVKGEATPGAPFGKDVRRMLDVAMADAKAFGYETRDFDGYACDITLPGESEEAIAVLGHLDVVPAGDNWATPPFTATRVGDQIFARGTSDDKGPALAALYGVTADDIASVELAGGFGNYLSPENVVRIGMLPRACLSKIRPLGNAALAGASMLALDGENWRKLAEIPEKCRYLELSGRDDFSRAFTDSLTF